MGVIIHRLPAKEAAARQAHFELMKRRLLSGLAATRQTPPVKSNATVK